jgi:hypothetical protein
MASDVALAKNLEFWHWYPRMLVQDLTPEQLYWQPESHDTSIIFALWHAYRAEDEILHALLVREPSVFASGGWEQRLPVSEKALTPFGNGFTREQIANVRLDVEPVLQYAEAVGARVSSYLASLDDGEAAADVPLPFFASVYPMLGSMTKAETVAFFSIGHVSEHLGEVQFIKGMLGMRGAPL